MYWVTMHAPRDDRPPLKMGIWLLFAVIGLLMRSRFILGTLLGVLMGDSYPPNFHPLTEHNVPQRVLMALCMGTLYWVLGWLYDIWREDTIAKRRIARSATAATNASQSATRNNGE